MRCSFSALPSEFYAVFFHFYIYNDGNFLKGRKVFLRCHSKKKILFVIKEECMCVCQK